MDSTLGTLIAPTLPEVFFRDHWQRQPLAVSRGEPGTYSHLVSLRDIDTLIYFGRPSFAQQSGPTHEEGVPRADSVVQGSLARQGRPAADSVPDLPALCRSYDEGKTVYVHNLERFWRPVADLCRGLEAALHHPADAGLFLTPPGAQGLPAHFDDRDVFVLQVEGSKDWRVYHPVEELPLEPRMITGPKDHLGPPLVEVRLEAGDLLYMPRGYVHEAFTSQTYSLHVTVGIEVFRWADLLSHALACVSRQDVRLREALPVGFQKDGEAAGALEQRFRELLQVLADGARVKDALGRLGDQFFRRLPALPDAHFLPGDAELDRLGPETVLEMRPGLICRVLDEGEAVSIQFPGNQIRGPKKIAAALHFIASAGRFAVRSLPGGLSDGSKLVLVKRLVRERLLRVVPEADAPPASPPP